MTLTVEWVLSALLLCGAAGFFVLLCYAFRLRPWRWWDDSPWGGK